MNNKILEATAASSQRTKHNDLNEYPKCFDIPQEHQKNCPSRSPSSCPMSNSLHIKIPPLLINEEDASAPHVGTCCEFDAIYKEMERKKAICDERNGSIFMPDVKTVSLKRILIVDDSMLCQKIIIKVLDGANYSFETAGNGKEACDKLGTIFSTFLSCLRSLYCIHCIDSPRKERSITSDAALPSTSPISTLILPIHHNRHQ